MACQTELFDDGWKIVFDMNIVAPFYQREIHILGIPGQVMKNCIENKLFLGFLCKFYIFFLIPSR